MSPWARALFRFIILVVVLVTLVLLFPSAARFVEKAARELRYLWWLVLLVALGIWLVWGIGHKPPKE